MGKITKWRVDRLACPEMRPDRRKLWDLLGDSRYRFWLDGGSKTNQGADNGFTYFAWGEPVWVFHGKNGRGEIRTKNGTVEKISFDDPTDVLRNLLGKGAVAGKAFGGGAVGFWGYECARYFERALDPGERSKKSPGTVPDFVWVLPPFWARWDPRGTVHLLSQRDSASPKDYNLLESWREKISGLPAEKRKTPPEKRGSFPEVLRAISKRRRADYEKKVRRIQRYIAAGDIYQANLTQRLEWAWGKGTRDPADFFDALRALNPSPYAALMQFDDFSLASCSPELLLRVRGDRAETRPIAGTRPRGATRREDRALSGELLLNEKERAEHVMLLDLERNDLGRVCRPGTVRVTEKMVLEKYSHVIHIVSHVEGRLKERQDGLHAMRALFPGGTITGCPKIRCMEILEELEREPRGPFFGSAGWIGFDGGMDLNILIRTALIQGNRLRLRVGAGIVADSVPAKEFEETLHKARALAAAYELCRRRTNGLS
ncbi:MAG: anthranilate synthase component I family protein [Elusimicrobia bacterium]|nr:anthranilate synthase component I family protein [Elusimicrobiota bacterium]